MLTTSRWHDFRGLVWAVGDVDILSWEGTVRGLGVVRSGM